MSTPVQLSGNQGAMIYLAESLAGLRMQQEQTNLLLRELIEVARGGSNGAQQDESDEPDEIAGLAGLLQRVPNGTPPTK